MTTCERTEHVQQCHLGGTIGGVCARIEVKEVTLLLQDICNEAGKSHTDSQPLRLQVATYRFRSATPKRGVGPAWTTRGPATLLPMFTVFTPSPQVRRPPPATLPVQLMAAVLMRFVLMDNVWMTLQNGSSYSPKTPVENPTTNSCVVWPEGAVGWSPCSWSDEEDDEAGPSG